ncbi:MAG: hypothetical protein AAF292_16270 [Pseudomonadota bacterium]
MPDERSDANDSINRIYGAAGNGGISKKLEKSKAEIMHEALDLIATTMRMYRSGNDQHPVDRVYNYAMTALDTVGSVADLKSGE